MADWYVDPTGTDDIAHGTAPGTDAFLTPSYAETQIANGDTVYVADGTYTDAQLFSAKAVDWIGESTVGTIFAFTGAARVLFLYGNGTRTFSNFTLVMNNPIAGAKYLVECDNDYDVNTTMTNCHFNNGRLASILVPSGASGLVIDNCTATIDSTSPGAFIIFVGSFTIRNTTLNASVATPNALFYQLAASTGNTFTIDGCTINSTIDASVVLATFGVLDSPTIINTDITVDSMFTSNVFEMKDNFNEVIEGNEVFIPSTDTGVNTLYLYATTTPNSVAKIRNNTFRTYGNANHVILIGSEDGVSSIRGSYATSIIDNNEIYCGAYYGYDVGNIHAIMCGYNRCFVTNNKIYGAGLGIVFKDTGIPIITAGYANGNELYNCNYGFRIKGARQVEVCNNKIKSTNETNSYAFCITKNEGEDYSYECELFNNIVHLTVGVVMSMDAGSQVGLQSDYNYYNFSGNFANNGTVYATLPLWTAATGLEQHSGSYNINVQREVPEMFSQSGIFTENYLTALYQEDNNAHPQACAVVKSNGLELFDGNGKYVRYDTTFFDENKKTTANDALTIEFEFQPGFAYDENSTRYLFQAGTGADEYSVYKQNNAVDNVLTIYLGGVKQFDIAAVDYSPYWNVDERTNLIITSENFVNVYLNNNLIATGGAAWSKKTLRSLYVGADSSGANTFDGYINSFSFTPYKITATEVLNRYNKNIYTFNWAGEWPLLASTLLTDTSGNDKDLSAGATNPTKLTARGYSTDGNDLLLSPNLATSATRITTMCVIKRIFASTVPKVVCSNGNVALTEVGDIFFYINGGFRYFVGSVDTNQRSIWTTPNSSNQGDFVLIGTYDGTQTCLWVNGQKGAFLAPVPIPPVINSSTVFSIFGRPDASNTCHAGTQILYAATGYFSVTEEQVRYLTNKYMKLLNMT